MSTKFAYFIFLLWAIAFVGCDKESITPENNDFSNNLIRFDAPAIGQMSFYEGIRRDTRTQPAEDQYFTVSDTLKVWIADEVSTDVFIFMEVLTQSEPTPRDTLAYIVDLTSPDTLKITIFHDANFDSYSLLFDRTGRAFPLQKITENEATIEGHYTIETPFDPQTGFMPGFTENFELNHAEYDHLNVFIDNNDMAFDGNGVTLLYSAKDGVVLSLVYNGFSGIGIGWELLQ